MLFEIAGRDPFGARVTRKFSRRGVIAGAALGVWAATGDVAHSTERASRMSAATSRVTTGAEIWAADRFSALAGRRVGLVTNHTGKVGEQHLVDLLHTLAPRLTLAAILAPEHGFRGSVEAGVTVGDGIDDRTKVPVFSLYGTNRRPTSAMLRGVDILVFDIQDIGVRYYTYISTMGLAMQAAAAAGIPFVVLDRPNPIGGTYVAGFSQDARQRSFVGQYAIPQVHGLTVGELASMIKGERLLSGLEALDLRVVGLEGWRRGMDWRHTGRPWVPPSPNVPRYETALLYAGTGLFEATTASEGRGTQLPFELIGATWADGERLVQRIMRVPQPGVRITSASFVPRAIPGMAKQPKFEGQKLGGVRLSVTNHPAVRPVETAIHLLAAFHAEAVRAGNARLISDTALFGRLAGTERLSHMLGDQVPPAGIIGAWSNDVRRFEALRLPYLRYPI